MLEVALNNIVKNYGAKNVLDSFNLEIYTKDRIAIIGPNGCGKSTLLSLITKEENPTSGSIGIRNKASIGILKQIQNVENDNLLLKDYLYLAIDDIIQFEKAMNLQASKLAFTADLEADLKRYAKMQEEFVLMGGYDAINRVGIVKAGLGITDSMLQTPFNSLSGGEKTIASLGSLLIKSPDILLLDEPTNHLDIDTLEWLESFIKGYAGTVVMVSHDRAFLNSCASKIVYIDDGKEDIYFGNYDYFLVEREIRFQQAEKLYNEQEKKVKKMKQQAHQLREWAKIADNKSLYKKAKQIEHRLEKMETTKKPKEEFYVDVSLGIKTRTGKDVLKVTGLDVSTNRLLLIDVCFEIFYQEKVAIIGPNGCGKSTLIKQILQEENNKIKIGSNVSIGYIPQEIHFADESKTIIEEMRRFYVGDETSLRRLLAKYNFFSSDIIKRLKDLSGGEKVRIKLLELIQRKHNLLILDEPTNHIDIKTREVLERALNEYNGTVLFVSHDRYFIDEVATKLILCKDGIVEEFYGNYSEYKKTIKK